MATRRAPAGRSVRIDAAGAVAGVVALLLAIVVLLRQRDAVGQVAGLDPFLLAIALLVAFVAPWALCVVVNIVGLLAGWLLGVGGFPRPTSPWLRARVLLAISATPLTAGALTVALAAGLARAEAASFDQVAIASCLLCAAFVTGQTAWRAGRLTLPWLLRPAERLANVAAARERFEAVSLLADPVEAAREDLVAAKSALIAAAAWEGRLAPESAASVGAYLAGNEAETLLFGLDRPALCCRPDGAVPLDPAERLAAAAALAEHAHALRPDYWFTAGALALVRLAQHRPTDARRLVRPHLEAGRRRRRDEDYRAQLLAVAAMTEVTGDPDRAIRLATSAWDALPAEGRRDHPAAPTIENVLTYVRRATRGASEASPS